MRNEATAEKELDARAQRHRLTSMNPSHAAFSLPRAARLEHSVVGTSGRLAWPPEGVSHTLKIGTALLIAVGTIISTASVVKSASANGFTADRWTGAWGSDGPIFTGDLNGDGKTDVFMWRDADKSWTINLSTGSGFAVDRWTGAWGSDGPIFTGDLNGDGKTDVFMWRDSDKSWTVNLSTGSGFTPARWTGAWGSDGTIRVADLNGDGKADVFM